jgi:hypothetical protein
VARHRLRRARLELGCAGYCQVKVASLKELLGQPFSRSDLMKRTAPVASRRVIRRARVQTNTSWSRGGDDGVGSTLLRLGHSIMSFAFEADGKSMELPVEEGIIGPMAFRKTSPRPRTRTIRPRQLYIAGRNANPDRYCNAGRRHQGTNRTHGNAEALQILVPGKCAVVSNPEIEELP